MADVSCLHLSSFSFMIFYYFSLLLWTATELAFCLQAKIVILVVVICLCTIEDLSFSLMILIYRNYDHELYATGFTAQKFSLKFSLSFHKELKVNSVSEPFEDKYCILLFF